MKKRSVLLLTVFLLVVSLTACQKADEEEVIHMGFVPLVEGDKLIESVEPFSDILSEELGVKVEAFTASNYVGVVEGLGSGQVDFGIIPPFAYVLANNESDAEVIMAALNDKGETGYYSEILVRKDSGIESLEELKGKTIAFVDPSSTSGYLFPGAYLKENGIDFENDMEYVYSGGHDKSLQLILNGDVDAIATFASVDIRYKDEFPTANEELVAVGRSEMIPGISVTVSSEMSEERREDLARALEGISENEEAQGLLIDLFNIHGFQKSGPEDYEIIKKTAEIMDVELD